MLFSNLPSDSPFQMFQDYYGRAENHGDKFAEISFPTLVEPVIETFLTISDSISCSETDAGSPESKFTTPSGTPHSLQISTNSITVPGVITSGLQITEQPAARAVDIFLDANINGKFHGTNAATTPTG